MGGPFFIPDIFERDLGPSPNFSALAAEPRVIGCILKATQGTSYAPAWFVNNWPRLAAAGANRSPWYRGAYHFAVPSVSGAAQADFFLAHVQRGGGYKSTDLAPIWDIEGAAWTSKELVVARSSEFAARIKERTGKDPILYAGATIRDLDITSHMGFAKLWTPHLDMSRAAWPLSQYAMWQYAGDGKLYDPRSAAYGFPTSIPGWGGTDMSVVMEGGAVAGSIGAVQAALGGSSLKTIAVIALAALTFLYLQKRGR